MTKKYENPIIDMDHNEEHKAWSRRDFLHTIGLAGSGLSFGLSSMSIHALNYSNLLMPPQGNEDRILVMLRLKGGNDGLNTVIPLFDYGTYQAKRPSIHIKQNDLLKLNNEHGIPKTMQSLMPLWNDGQMKVVNTVGYDNHNLSHFTSSDIWNSGNQMIDAIQDKSGWLGRYILNRTPDYLENLPPFPGAIKINSGSNITYQNSDRIDLSINFNSPEKMLEIAEKGFLYDTINLPDQCYYGDQVGYLRSILNVTYKYAPVISEAYKKSTNSVGYSNNELSRQLSIVARLIKGNLGTKLYMVTLDGFDTHENQNQDHPRLMNQLATAVSEFFKDLESSGQDEKVLLTSFSEFGRRIQENQGGTDHGTAAPVMIFGPALNGNGFVGENPDLKNVDANGNLKHSVDFRSIYATLLESWLCLDPQNVDRVLGAKYDRIPELGLTCLETSTKDEAETFVSIHKAIDAGSEILIEFDMLHSDRVVLEIFSISGQKVTTLFNGEKGQGNHSVSFQKSSANAGIYVYRLHIGKKGYGGKFISL